MSSSAHQIYQKSSPIDAPVEALFAYHMRPGAFMRLNPPWEPVEILSYPEQIGEGAMAAVRLKLGPVPVRWQLEHQHFETNRQFEDRQTAGPFAFWKHTHRTEPDGEQTSILTDRIEYQLPLGTVGQMVAGRFSQAKLERMFTYRHEITQQDLITQLAYPTEPLKIAVTGASGLIGSQLVAFLTTAGHQVKKLVRSRSTGQDEIYWNPAQNEIDATALAGLDAVIHLAGESIAEGRWSEAKKRRILESRINGTRLLAETLAGLEQPPRVLISASAIGYYGDQGQAVLTEDSPSGDLFLSEVCRQWEAAADPAREAGIRVVHPRFGVVLSMSGGALAQMLLPFQMGVGGVIGGGQQIMSWIALDDVIGALYHLIMTPTVEGGVNLTAPCPVSNRAFTAALGRVLSRPTVLPLPAFGMKLMFGEMADELLIASSHVQPDQLTETGYRFRYTELEPALRHVLGKQA